MIAAAAAAFVAKHQLEAVDDENGDEVHLVSIFGPMAFHSTASAFRGGTIDCWYGGGVVDLRDARLDPAGAQLEVRAIFGGGQVLVPAEWQVESTVAGIGAARDMRPAQVRSADAPVLKLHGFVLFGGFGVMSDMPKEAIEQLTAAVAKQRDQNGSNAPEVVMEPAPTA
jgi:hypothetical protein